MGRAKNTLKRSEVSSTPIKLRYSTTYASNSLASNGISITTGSNFPYNVNMASVDRQRMNNYRMVQQLFYKQAVSSSIGSSSFWDPMWQSTAASGTNDATYYNFPLQYTGSIVIFAIPSYQFGEQVSRKSLVLASTGVGSQYRIVDDGNGNLIDTLAGNEKVGNIFYAQGIAVITNSDYTAPPIVITELIAESGEILTTEAEDSIIT